MKAKIVYASMTGNDEDMAEILEDDLVNAGFEVDNSDVNFADATEYLDYDLCVFITYTYGEGVMTDEISDFYEQLKDVNLTGKKFVVMGSGDKTYGEHYCENVFDFEKMFIKCGATEITKPVTIENSPDDDAVAKIDAAADEISDQMLN